MNRCWTKNDFSPVTGLIIAVRSDCRCSCFRIHIYCSSALTWCLSSISESFCIFQSSLKISVSNVTRSVYNVLQYVISQAFPV
uniref:Uncharacterized protein n=1 Tax=Setaria italica TaxID=4555 RepID=K4A3V8_SETIT